MQPMCEQLVGRSDEMLGVSCRLSVGCGGIVGCGGYLGVCAHHWGHRAELCSVWEGGRLVQAQLTPKSSPGIAWLQALHHKVFAAVFFSSWTLPL